MSNSTRRSITAEDLYEIDLVSNPQLSPNGHHVIYGQQRINQKTEKKYSNLWAAHLENGQVQQYTYGNQVDRQPRFSPDGQTLAFISNRKGGKQDQIYLLPFYGGEAKPLTSFKGAISSFRWSPDGRKLVVVFRQKDKAEVEREEDKDKRKLGVVARHITRLDFKNDGAGFAPEEHWHLWLVDVESGEKTQLTETSTYDETEPCWFPDGSKILFRSNRSAEPDLAWDADELYTVSVDDGQIEKVETPFGRKSDPVVSPDGRWIAYYGYGDRQALWAQVAIWLISTAGDKAPQNLTEAYDLDITHDTLNDSCGGPIIAPIWSNDSQQIYFQASRHGSTTLNRIDISNREMITMIAGPGAVGDLTFDAAQMQVTYLLGKIDDPGQIMIQDLRTGEARALTTVNQTLFANIDLGQLEEVWYKNEAGMDLQGWILKPPGFDPSQKYPAILEIHGGPMGQYGHAFMHEFYYLAAQGYVVFYTNPRGGRGYGQEHTKAIANNWGTADFADVMTWTDQVVQRPYIDETRLGVTGGSYGGYMTNWTITHTDRFKAAVTQRCVSNFISMFGSSDLTTRWQALFGAEAPPWDDVENYWRQSQLKYIGNVKTPTLVIHSEQDLRCHIEQGEQVFVALKVLGVDTEMVRFPDESHGLSRGGRTDRRIVRLNHIVRWFDKYLKS